MSRPRRLVVLAAAAALLALPGCSGSSGSSSDADPAAAPAKAAAGDGKTIDACSLLTKAEIAAVLGVEVAGTGSGGTCTWEEEETYHSVTLDVGDANTAAADGTFPDPLPGAAVEDGPDGIRYSSGNVAEFIVDGRLCQVQVVTSVTDESDRPAAVKLVNLVRGRIGR